MSGYPITDHFPKGTWYHGVESVTLPDFGPYHCDLHSGSCGLGLLNLIADKYKAMSASFIWKLEEITFWEPARYALENGGCRQ